MSGIEIKRGTLAIQSDREDGEISPERQKALEKAGAKASIAFAASKHGAWIAGQDFSITEDAFVKLAKAEVEPDVPPSYVVTEKDGKPVAEQNPNLIGANFAAEELSEEDRLLLEEIGEDRWVTDDAPRKPAPIPGSVANTDREPTAELVALGSKKRTMKTIPGLGKDDIGVKRVGGIILGRELKMNLAMYTGGELNVMSPTGDVGPAGGLPKSRPFKLVGSYYSGMFDFDAKMGYISLKDAQSLLGIGSRVTGIDVKCTDVEDSIKVRDAIKAELADVPNIKVEDWMTLNASLFSAIKLEKFAMFTILTSIILVASFNILCLLLMMVIEKAREIAIFKAMGTTTWSVVRIFVVQGAAIGLLGTFIGASLGLTLCWLIANLGFKLPSGVYYITQIPVTINPLEVTMICIAGIGISLLSTILPSILAVRLDPVEGLRHE